MTVPFEVVTGSWVRFSGYVIRDGAIRPEPGAKLEPYDPWEEFRRIRGDRSGEAPYESLANLHQSLQHDWGSSRVARDSYPAILDWCERYGLLGVLPHRVLSVDLNPWWHVEGERTSFLQKSYVRMNDRWDWMSDGWVIKPELVHEQLARGGPIEQAAWAPKPKVTIQDFYATRISQEPLPKTWWRFFSDVPAEEAETYEYPLPLSADFWAQYGEPVEDFVLGASFVGRAFQNLTRVRADAEAADTRRFDRAAGMTCLNALVSGIRPSVTMDDQDGRFRQEWGCLSLLSSLAMMALQDLTEGRRLLQCEVCGRLFVTDAYQARYCSDSCRWTAQKRAYRAGLRQKKADGGRKE
jgi:hypothetical protein